MNITQTIAPEVDAAIRRSISEAMSTYSLERIDIRAGEDHVGLPAIFVEARYALSSTPFDPAGAVDLRMAVMGAVWALGEDRFVYVRNLFDDRQPIAKRRRRAAA
jgi:hypothetical protein